jgi:MFS family permease
VQLVHIAVAAMLAQQAFAYMAGLVMPVAAPAVAQDLGLNPALVGAFTGIVFFASMLSQVSCGAFIQRLGPLRVSQICLVGMACGLLTISSGVLPLIVVAALVIGTGAAPSTPASSQILARLSPPHLAPLFFSIKQTGVPVGAMLAGAVVPISIAWFGWRGAFIVAAGLCLSLAVVLQPLRRDLDRDRDPAARFSARAALDTLRGVLRSRDLRVLAIAAYAFVGLQAVFASFFVIYLTGPLGHDLATAGIAFSITQGVAIPTRILWGWIGSRFIAARTMLAILGFGMALASIVLGLTGAGWPLVAVVLIGCVYSATAVSWHGVLLAEVARLAPRERVGTMTGGVLSFGSAGMMSFPLVFGGILAATEVYAYGFFLAAIPALGASFLLLRR